eukprot:jgi/Botrbrau1/5253/Bobra.0172s0112.1
MRTSEFHGQRFAGQGIHCASLYAKGTVFRPAKKFIRFHFYGQDVVCQPVTRSLLMLWHVLYGRYCRPLVAINDAKVPPQCSVSSDSSFARFLELGYSSNFRGKTKFAFRNWLIISRRPEIHRQLSLNRANYIIGHSLKDQLSEPKAGAGAWFPPTAPKYLRHGMTSGHSQRFSCMMLATERKQSISALTSIKYDDTARPRLSFKDARPGKRAHKLTTTILSRSEARVKLNTTFKIKSATFVIRARRQEGDADLLHRTRSTPSILPKRGTRVGPTQDGCVSKTASHRVAHVQHFLSNVT